MINVQPTQPGCIAATQLRMEFEFSDVEVIAEYLGTTSDELLQNRAPDLFAEWALQILSKWFEDRGVSTGRLPKEYDQ